MADQTSSVTTCYVTSSDGARIGYRQMGQGPGLLLLHGGMQSSQSFMQLAKALSDNFTLYVPDRRGRGLSGPHSDGFSIQTEINDLSALLSATCAKDVFALSSGALIAMQASLSGAPIRRMALYEPPLGIEGVRSPAVWVPAYEREMAAGNLAGAMVAFIKGTADREFFTRLPGFVLETMFGLGLRAMAGGAALRALIPTMHYDALVVQEMLGRIEDFRHVRIETLLLRGTISADYLIAAVDALATVIPNSKRVVLNGLGHIAADNEGQPAVVAAELRRFFS